MRRAGADEVGFDPAARLVGVVRGVEDALVIEFVDAVVGGADGVHRDLHDSVSAILFSQMAKVKLNPKSKNQSCSARAR